MPAGSLTDAGGEKRVLRDLLGKSLTVVVCWNAGNPFALDQFEELTTEVVPLAAQGVAVVAIHAGKKPDNYAALIKEHGTGVTCLLDEDEAYFHELATRRLPRTYVVDGQGKIVWLDIEYSRTTRYELRNAMHYQLQGKKQ